MLRGGPWVKQLQPDFHYSDVLIRDECNQAVNAIVNWYAEGKIDLGESMDMDNAIPASLRNPFLDMKPGNISQWRGFVLAGAPGTGE